MKLYPFLFFFFAVFYGKMYGQQAIISNREGISYKILKKEFINEPNALRCGYNDLGFPITARTTVEVREYEEYSKGKLVRRWTEKVKTETKCLE